MILKRYLIGILLMTGFLSACTVRELSDDNGLEVAEKDSIRINIQIKSNLVSSRTPVIDPEDDTSDHDGKQHVTYVHLYMFQLTGNNYKLVYDSPVDWTENLPAPSVGEDKKTGTHTIAIDSYDADAEYYFVAVGLDAESGYPGYTGQETGLSGNSADAYWEQIQKFMTEGLNFGFNESDKSPSFPEVCGITSVEKDGVSINPIPRSEFFAGGTYVENIKNENITVVANRRVAGIKAYFKGIPDKIDESEVCYLAFGTGPSEEFYSRYNNCLPLLPLSAQVGQEYSDYYSKTEDYLENSYPIIVPVNNSEAGVEKSVGIGRSSGTGTLSELLPDEDLIDQNYTDGLAVVMGYLPPVVFPAEETGSNSTLMLYLLDENFQVLSKKRIVQNSEINLPLSREGTGIIPGEGGYDGRYHYPIMANHIYRIGSKGNPVNLDASEAEIVVSIDEFQDEYYGGHLGGGDPDGVNIDTSWGDHDAGNLDNK